jgi:hypothetical protein
MWGLYGEEIKQDGNASLFCEPHRLAETNSND